MSEFTGAELALRISQDAEFLKFVSMGKPKSAAMRAALIAKSATERTVEYETVPLSTRTPTHWYCDGCDEFVRESCTLCRNGDGPMNDIP